MQNGRELVYRYHAGQLLDQCRGILAGAHQRQIELAGAQRRRQDLLRIRGFGDGTRLGCTGGRHHEGDDRLRGQFGAVEPVLELEWICFTARAGNGRMFEIGQRQQPGPDLGERRDRIELFLACAKFQEELGRRASELELLLVRQVHITHTIWGQRTDAELVAPAFQGKVGQLGAARILHRRGVADETRRVDDHRGLGNQLLECLEAFHDLLCRVLVKVDLDCCETAAQLAQLGVQVGDRFGAGKLDGPDGVHAVLGLGHGKVAAAKVGGNDRVEMLLVGRGIVGGCEPDDVGAVAEVESALQGRDGKRVQRLLGQDWRAGHQIDQRRGAVTRYSGRAQIGFYGIAVFRIVENAVMAAGQA